MACLWSLDKLHLSLKPVCIIALINGPVFSFTQSPALLPSPKSYDDIFPVSFRIKWKKLRQQFLCTKGRHALFTQAAHCWIQLVIEIRLWNVVVFHCYLCLYESWWDTFLLHVTWPVQQPKIETSQQNKRSGRFWWLICVKIVKQVAKTYWHPHWLVFLTFALSPTPHSGGVAGCPEGWACYGWFREWRWGRGQFPVSFTSEHTQIFPSITIHFQCMQANVASLF